MTLHRSLLGMKLCSCCFLERREGRFRTTAMFQGSQPLRRADPFKKRLSGGVGERVGHFCQSTCTCVSFVDTVTNAIEIKIFSSPPRRRAACVPPDDLWTVHAAFSPRGQKADLWTGLYGPAVNADISLRNFHCNIQRIFGKALLHGVVFVCRVL